MNFLEKLILPEAFKQNAEKLSARKTFSFIAWVVDISDLTFAFEYFHKFS
jgi:hypothetical protein